MLFAKKNKPGVQEAIDYLNSKVNNLVLFLGERGKEFPQEAFSSYADILISYLSPWIIPEGVLKRTKLFNINFHPGPPEYPGIGCFNFAIYKWGTEYGVVAHIMEGQVDKGKIIGVKRFPLLKEDSVSSLSIKSYKYMLDLFTEVMQFILDYKKLPECNETWKRKPYKRKDLEDLCRLNKEMTKEEIERRIRATEYPGMPGAYFDLFDYKFEYNPKR